ncbi:MAG: hypothetical protein F9K47_09260, partial [Burkholderiales bacterium]
MEKSANPESVSAAASNWRRPFSPLFGALLVLALGLVVTLFLAKRVTDHTTGEVEARFAARGDLLAAHLSRRLNDLQNLILGLQGVFIASPDVTRAEFHQYARNLDLAKRLGGLQAMSYHRRVTLAERHAFMAAVRTDRSLVPEGYPRFDIRPPGDPAEY